MIAAANTSRRASGFNDLASDSQRVFRAVLEAMSRPGRLVTNPVACHPPFPLPSAMASIALCLVDCEAAVWLDDVLNVAPVAEFLQFHTGAELCADPSAAAFALIARPEAMPEFEAFNSGSALCPEQSATLVIQTAALEGGSPVHLTGPGIERRKAIAPLGLPSWFWDDWVANTQRFPLGIDVLMTDAWHFMGLPRTARRVDP